MGVNYYSTVKIIILRPSYVPEEVGVNQKGVNENISIKRDVSKW
jgi:hypothetical protein